MFWSYVTINRRFQNFRSTLTQLLNLRIHGNVKMESKAEKDFSGPPKLRNGGIQDEVTLFLHNVVNSQSKSLGQFVI
jgi:hypothetical protein